MAKDQENKGIRREPFSSAVFSCAQGLPLSPLCDKEKHGDMAKSQAGFLEFVVKPLLKEIEEIDPFGRVRYLTHASLKLGSFHTRFSLWRTLSRRYLHASVKLRYVSNSPQEGRRTCSRLLDGV